MQVKRTDGCVVFGDQSNQETKSSEKSSSTKITSCALELVRRWYL